jgi:hypothetical protein
MVGAWIVEIDDLLDQSEAENLRVEIEVAMGRAADCGNVMKPCVAHDRTPIAQMQVRSKCRRQLPIDVIFSPPATGRLADNVLK